MTKSTKIEIMILENVESTGGGDFLNTLIAVSIILLILSLINEKFVELIRKHFKVSERINRRNWLKTVNLPYTNNTELNEKRKKEINLLAIFVGISVAALSKASLFDMLSHSEPQKILFWSNGTDFDGNFFWFILGIVFTGFFLSFGSKFFHDLLDTLYQTKEYKRKLQNKQLFNQSSYKDLVDFINTDSHRLAKQALLEHGPIIKKKYESIVSSIELGNTVHNQIGLIVTLKAPPPSEFPKVVATKLPNGTKVMIVVETIEKEVGQSHYGLEFRLENPDYATSTGALGGILVAQNGGQVKYILTCSHVVLGGSSDDMRGYLDSEKQINILEQGIPKTQGSLVYAKLDSSNDTALVSISEWDMEQWNNELPDGNLYGSAVPVESLSLTDKVGFYSTKDNAFKEGVVNRTRSADKISLQYDDSITKEFEGVIIVGNNNNGIWTPISEKGDSGAVLYNKRHEPFGIIIGGCSQFTYALPLTDILEETNTRIYTNQNFA